MESAVFSFQFLSTSHGFLQFNVFSPQLARPSPHISILKIDTVHPQLELLTHLHVTIMLYLHNSSILPFFIHTIQSISYSLWLKMTVSLFLILSVKYNRRWSGHCIRLISYYPKCPFSGYFQPG